MGLNVNRISNRINEIHSIQATVSTTFVAHCSSSPIPRSIVQNSTLIEISEEMNFFSTLSITLTTPLYYILVLPRVEVTPSQLSVNQGSSFRLFCLVRPLLPVKWSKVNGRIPSGSEQGKGTLIVNKVEVEYTGKYRCHASNAAGSSEAFTSVTVFGKDFQIDNI